MDERITWRVRYHYVADRPGWRPVHEAESPRALVQFMRDHFRGNPYLDVIKVWEAPHVETPPPPRTRYRR